MLTAAPQYPAVLKLSDDDIISYVESPRQLLQELQSHYHIDHALLIDSQGNSFSPDIQVNNHINYQPVAETSLSDFNQMVRNHLSARQQCCVLKITIENFHQGLQLIRETTER